MKQILLGAGSASLAIRGLASLATTLQGSGWRPCIYLGSIWKHWKRHNICKLLNFVYTTPRFAPPARGVKIEQKTSVIFQIKCRQLLTNADKYV